MQSECQLLHAISCPVIHWAPFIGARTHPFKLSHPEPRSRDLDALILHPSVRKDILAGLRAIEMREQLEAVWNISAIQPQLGRCILNF